MSPSAKSLIGAVAMAGAVVLASGLRQWGAHDYGRFAALLTLSLVASRLKISFPGINGSMSVNLPFILIAAAELTAPEALLIACLSTLAQCLPSRGTRQKPVQILFNVCTMINAVALASLAFHRAALHAAAAKSLLVTLAAAAFFAADTLPVAAIISLTDRQSLAGVWHGIFQLTFPYFVLSTGVVAIVGTASQYVGRQGPLAALLVMYGVYCSYQTYFRQPAESALPEVAQTASAAD